MQATTSTPRAPTSVRLTQKLRRAILRAALADERTQSQQIVWLIQKGLAERARQLQERAP
jgi:hypothetical protein